MTWYYNNEEYKQTPEDYQGFVYEITEIKTGKKYIAKSYEEHMKYKKMGYVYKKSQSDCKKHNK